MSSFGTKKGGSIDSTEFITTIVRYSILLVLLSITFYYMKYPNLQFMGLIILLIVVVLGTTFVIRDLALTQGIWESLSKNDIFSLFTTNAVLLYVFLFAVVFSVIFKIISVTLMIVVFNYGRKQLSTDEDITKHLTFDNSVLLKRYKKFTTISIVMTILLLVLIFITYSSQETRIVLKNIFSIALTVGIIGLSCYEMVFASKMLDVFKKKGVLYEINHSPAQL
jgi:hypothetical protein